MSTTSGRAAAWTLVTGCVLATLGYASAFAFSGPGDGRFAASHWPLLYTVGLFGDVLVVLGLPALLSAQAGRSPRLTMLGYAGALVPLTVLNVGEGVVEAFVKPWFALHGGGPMGDLPGLSLFEAPALLIMLIGMICLGVATWRARQLPRWVALAFVVVPILGAAGLSGWVSLLPDYLLFVTLARVSVRVLRPGVGEASAADSDEDMAGVLRVDA